MAALRARLLDGLSGEPAAWVEALRGEASRFYHTDAAAARRIAARALEVAAITGDPLALGWGHRAVAESLLFSGRMREAEAAYARAAEAWRACGAFGLLGQLLVGRIHVLSLLGRMKEVTAAAEEARRHLSSSGDDAYLAKLSMNLGNLRFQRDEYAEALAEYARAADVFARLGVRDETVLGLEVNRAVVLTQLDRDAEALELFDRLERECTRRNYELLRAQVRMNAAWVHQQRADFDLALRDLGQAAGYFHRTDHPSFFASCLLNRAEIYHQLHLYSDALDLAREALPLFEQAGLGYDAGLALTQSALARLAADEVSAALPEIRKALALFEREKNPSRVALMELLWAEALVRRRRWREAEERARKAARAFRRLGLIRWESTASVLLARLEARRISPERQLPRLRALLHRLPERLYPLSACALLEALGDAQERSGQPRAAAGSYRRALHRLERLRGRIPTEDSKVAFLGGRTHLYDRLLRLELARPRPSADRIFEWIERSRAQSLWDRLRLPAAPLGEDPNLAERRRRLSWLHARVSRLELGSPGERARATELRRELAGAEQDWSRALRARAEENGSAALGIENREAPSLREFSATVPEGAGFLSYHIGEDFSLAFVVTRDGVTWRRLRPDLRARLEEIAERLDFQWNASAMLSASRSSTALMHSGPGPEEWLRATADGLLSDVHELLWKPVLELGVDARLRWIISPHGPAHRIPLHAMRGPDGYIIEQTDLTLAPSARIWRELPVSRRSPRPTAWIAGVPSVQLPAVQREVERVARRLTGWKVTADFAPTRDRMRREGRRSGLLHLATHGSLRRDNPAFSFVQLADGPLFVHDLGAFQLPASTVVLTACSSGQGIAPAGDEWIGLARGFLQAGAATVVASLWPIQDEPTLELMESFYEGIASGEDVPAALGGAMRRLLRLRPHPWQWASFAALGGRGAERPGPRSRSRGTPAGSL